MGLIKAAIQAVGGNLRDQYLEFFTCDSLGQEVLLRRIGALGHLADDLGEVPLRRFRLHVAVVAALNAAALADCLVGETSCQVGPRHLAPVAHKVVDHQVEYVGKDIHLVNSRG